jgi:hypothetical protein
MAVKTPALELIVWANITKWQTLRGVADEAIASVLLVKSLPDRRRKLYLTVEEMGRICKLLAIEPEKLLER